jgi:integrase
MKRSRSDVPNYLHHKATGLGYARLAGRNGRPTYFPGAYGSRESKDAYDAAVADWLKNGRQAPAAEPAPVRSLETTIVADLVNAFLDYKQEKRLYTKYGRETSERYSLDCAFRVLLDKYEREPTGAIGLPQMQVLRQAMVDLGWAEGTVKRHMQRVRSLFVWGRQQTPKLVPDGATYVQREGLGRKSVVRGRRTEQRKPPDPKAVAAVERAACPTIRAMIGLQRMTGMRSQGVCELRPCDIDRSRKVWLYTEPIELAAKTGRERHHLGPRCQKILQPFLDATPSETARVFRTELRPGANTTGGWTRSYYRRTIANLCEALQVEHWFPHQLRHAHGTMIENRYGREAARKRLGHTHQNTTAIYTSGADEILDKIALEVS